MASAIAKSEEEQYQGGDQGGPSTSGATPQAVPPPPASSTVSEESIQEVMAAGFSRESAIEELQNCNGDATAAKAVLFAKAFKF